MRTHHVFVLVTAKMGPNACLCDIKPCIEFYCRDQYLVHFGLQSTFLDRAPPNVNSLRNVWHSSTVVRGLNVRAGEPTSRSQSMLTLGPLSTEISPQSPSALIE